MRPPSDVWSFQNRPTTGANAVSAHSDTAAITVPFWVKVERKGNQFTAYYSQDGAICRRHPPRERSDAGVYYSAVPVYDWMASVGNRSGTGRRSNRGDPERIISPSTWMDP